MLLTFSVAGFDEVAINLNPYQGLKPGLPDVHIRVTGSVAINLNPYQGLKLRLTATTNNRFAKVAINLNPYQGLKHLDFPFKFMPDIVAINLNPYQGLKLITDSIVSQRGY